MGMFVIVHVDFLAGITLFYVAAVALKPRWSTTLIKAAAEVLCGSNETRADPTATCSTFAPATAFNAVDTFEAQPPQCMP
jgi:hypothetical protein